MIRVFLFVLCFFGCMHAAFAESKKNRIYVGIGADNVAGHGNENPTPYFNLEVASRELYDLGF